MKLRYVATSYAVMGLLAYGRTRDWSLCPDNGLSGHLLYMFCSSSLVHYMLNGVVWCVMWKSVTIVRTLFAWLAAVIVGYLLPVTLPVCGWSVVLYFYLGMMMRQMAMDVRFRLLCATLIGLFVPGIAVWHHIGMLACGYACEWGTSHWGARMTYDGALSEAIYITSLERNADIVRMASFAPMFAKESQKRWVADMIYFTNDTVMPTASYQVQKMCGQTAGDTYIPSKLQVSGEVDMKGVAQSVVYDNATHTYHLKLVNHTDQSLNLIIDKELISGAQPLATIRTLTSTSLTSRDATLTTHSVPTSTLHTTLLPPQSFTIISFCVAIP